MASHGDEDNGMSKFMEYFQKQYVRRVEQWAPCYRDKSLVNTNMAFEAFHRVIKVCYMEKKHNRRIDYLIHILLKVARDKVFERLQKTHKGKSSYRLCEVNRKQLKIYHLLISFHSAKTHGKLNQVALTSLITL